MVDNAMMVSDPCLKHLEELDYKLEDLPADKEDGVKQMIKYF